MTSSADRERLDPACLGALGLQDQPFADTPTIYEDEDQATRLGIALAAMRDGGLVVLSGPEGVGKTTFLRQLQHQAHDLSVTTIDGRRRLQLPDLMAAIGAETDEAMPSEISTVLRDAARQPALAIDDGESMSSAVIKRLVRLQATLAEKGLALPVIVACERSQAESLTATLEANKHSLVPLQRVALSGFGPLDANAYLRLRLAEAGGDNELLDDRQLTRIHRRSAGHPGRLHVEAVRELERNAGRSRPFWQQLNGLALPARLRDPRLGIAAGMAALAATGLGWWLASGPAPPTRIDSNQPVATADTADEQATGQGAKPAGGGSSTGEPADGSMAEPSDDEAVSAEPAGSGSPPDGGPTPTAETSGDAPAAPAAEAPTSDEDATASSQPVANGNGNSTPQPEPTSPSSDATAAADDAGTATDQPAPDQATRQQDRAANSEPEGASSTAASADSGASSEAANASTSSATADADIDLDQQWLQNQPEDHFTIQILGARKPATVQRFLGQIEATDDTRILRTRHDGEPWYVVVTGSYAERSAAKAAINELSAGSREHDPFPQSFESLSPGD